MSTSESFVAAGLPQHYNFEFAPDNVSYNCCPTCQRLVLSSISKMESSRKSFRLIGGVLVQQTVGEVLPAVQDYKNMVSEVTARPIQNNYHPVACGKLRALIRLYFLGENSLQIKQLLDNVSGTLAAKEKEAAAWKVKYNIQTQQERELARAQALEAAAAAPEKSVEAQKGVLA